MVTLHLWARWLMVPSSCARSIDARLQKRWSTQLGLVIFSYGGISQTLVGMCEMFLGLTVFTTYGGFNFTFGALYLPQIGLVASYTIDGVVGQEFYNTIGIYLAIWESEEVCFANTTLIISQPLRTSYNRPRRYNARTDLIQRHCILKTLCRDT
ncbi:hypothetical protein BDR06DRAFT_1004493 [Suillus hirtellus]|nr:hypothetical protein BDR06DRAFT_1004493 [Suillus hirtellus]